MNNWHHKGNICNENWHDDGQNETGGKLVMPVQLFEHAARWLLAGFAARRAFEERCSYCAPSAVSDDVVIEILFHLTMKEVQTILQSTYGKSHLFLTMRAVFFEG